MQFRSAVRDRFLRRHLDQSSGAEQLGKALAEFDEGNVDEGHAILQPLVSASNPQALLLASMFSMENESDQEFSERHLTQLQQAASLGDSAAMYMLGVYLDMGHFLELDRSRAFDCFRKSAGAGMPQAMHVYGIMLYYGTGGAPLQRSEGLLMVEAAASAGVNEAVEFLDFLQRQK